MYGFLLRMFIFQEAFPEPGWSPWLASWVWSCLSSHILLLSTKKPQTRLKQQSGKSLGWGRNTSAGDYQGQTGLGPISWLDLGRKAGGPRSGLGCRRLHPAQRNMMPAHTDSTAGGKSAAQAPPGLSRQPGLQGYSVDTQ